MADSRNPGALANATGAERPIQANADGFPQIARNAKGGTAYRITPRAGEPFTIFVSGRVRWALERLQKAGAMGCTPIDELAPRWSAYVHSLRKLGLEIETLREPHGGEFPGQHARYVLLSTATPCLHSRNVSGSIGDE